MNLQTLRCWNAVAGRVAPKQVARLNLRLMATPRRLAPKPWEQAIAAEGTPLRLAQGWRALSWGEGPLVLCLHGWEGRGTQFEAFVRPLVAAGHRVVALDGPAHGASHGRLADPVLFANCLLDAAAELGPPHALIGHSMGGAATAYALTLAPERLRPARAVLIAAPASYRSVLDRHMELVNLRGAAQEALFAQLAGYFAQERGTELGEIELQERAGRVAPETSILIVHDQDDEVISVAQAQTYRETWPQARLLQTSGLGHLRVMRDPLVVAAVVGFVGGAVLSDREAAV